MAKDTPSKKKSAKKTPEKSTASRVQREAGKRKYLGILEERKKEARSGKKAKKSVSHKKEKYIKVRLGTHIKKVGGSICHYIKQHGVAPTVQGGGIKVINQCVKSIIIARTFLRNENEKLDVVIYGPIYEGLKSVLFPLRLQKGTCFDSSEDAERKFRVSSESTTKDGLSGALLGEFRDNKIERVAVTAMGARAVNIATQGISIAVLIMKRDFKIQLKCAPRFCDIFTEGGEKRTGITFIVKR